MSDQIKMGFGTFQSDTDDKLQSKGGGVFGLNTGARITKFELNRNAGKDGAPGNAIDVTVTVVDKEFMARFYEITKVYGRDNNEITDVNSPEYIAGYNKEFTQLSAVMTHILKCFVTEEMIAAATSTPAIVDFASWATALQGLVPAGFQTQLMDVFLEYQWKIRGEATRTFLQLPKNMKGGYWIVKSQGEGFQKVEGIGVLKYANPAGLEHTFNRSANFMSSNKAIMQDESGDSNGGQAPAANVNFGTPAAGTPTSW